MDFLDVISDDNVLLLDGAMGTELDKRGLSSRIRANLDSPEAVIGVHRDYLDAGCRALITNTLIMNRVYLETHQIDVDVADVNRSGAELTRRAANENTCVLGNLCSTGQLIEPYGTLAETAAYDAFKEQAGYLAEAGVDAFIIETVYDLREALCAVRACREFSPPVIASISFTTEQNGGRTVMGDSAAQCAVQLTDAGVGRRSRHQLRRPRSRTDGHRRLPPRRQHRSSRTRRAKRRQAPAHRWPDRVRHGARAVCARRFGLQRGRRHPHRRLLRQLTGPYPRRGRSARRPIEPTPPAKGSA